MPLPNILPTSFIQPRDVLRSLPGAVVRPVAYVPFVLQKPIISKLLLTLFKESLEDGDLDCLKGRWLSIEVRDMNVCLQMSCGPNHEVLVRRNGPSDVCIRGDLKSFIFLAARKEDPDTLFFQRDLVIEGDTDLGLTIKNLMDSLDLDTLPPELRFLVKSGAEYMDSFCD